MMLTQDVDRGSILRQMAASLVNTLFAMPWPGLNECRHFQAAKSHPVRIIPAGRVPHARYL
jgi:hypothetical protein